MLKVVNVCGIYVYVVNSEVFDGANGQNIILSVWRWTADTVWRAERVQEERLVCVDDVLVS